VFNHPVLGFSSTQGNLCIDCGGNAGQVTNIEADASPNAPNGMRQLQFGLRFFLTPNIPKTRERSPSRAPPFCV